MSTSTYVAFAGSSKLTMTPDNTPFMDATDSAAAVAAATLPLVSFDTSLVYSKAAANAATSEIR